MGFIDSYKRLEKLCNEVFNDDIRRGISAYINEMTNTPNGSRYVRNWNEDWKNLKHYRWMRNQIVHEPGCTEQTMCQPEDELWLDEFYSRIMNQTDPLTLYRQATCPDAKAASNPIQKSPTHTHSNNYGKSTISNVGLLIFIITFLMAIVGIILLSQYI